MTLASTLVTQVFANSAGSKRTLKGHAVHLATIGLALVMLCGALPIFSLTPPTTRPVRRAFTLRKLRLNPLERVTGIDLKLTGAMFDEVRPLPQGWTISVDNDPNWHTEFSGDITVGAASLDNVQLEKVRFYVTEDKTLGIAFKVSGTIHVTTWNSPERDIPITFSNLYFEKKR